VLTELKINKVPNWTFWFILISLVENYGSIEFIWIEIINVIVNNELLIKDVYIYIFINPMLIGGNDHKVHN